MAGIGQWFGLEQRNSTVGRELRGAAATFLTMAYILFANPSILSAAGVPLAPAVAATALAAGINCILMGLIANFPIAMAAGMGLNGIVAYQIAVQTGSWQLAMGVIVLDGLVVLLLVLTGLREAVLHAIPRDLRLAIGAGIGLFIAFIGLVKAGIVVQGPNSEVPVAFGSFTDRSTLVALFGLVVTGMLMARQFRGAIVIGIVAATGVAILLRVAHWPAEIGWPSFETLFQANVRGALRWDLMPVLFAVVLVDFFDTLGTVTAIGHQAGLVDPTGKIPALRRILIVDSAAASIGGLCGVSSNTSYVESAAGVAEGARTGLHSVFVGMMFLAAIFLAPIAAVVPGAATAPALILVGFLMIEQMAEIKWAELDTSIAAFITLLTIPLTYSISHGIGLGFIAYVLIRAVSGKAKQVHPLMYGVAVAFAVYFAEPWLRTML